MTLPVLMGGFGASGVTGYQIARSLRLRSAASAYLSRTFGAGGNQKKWTWAGWVKRGQFGVRQDFYSVFNTNTDAGAFYFNFGTDDCLHVTSYSVDYRITTQFFRDPGAWMFVLVALDAANTTCRVEINGVAVSSFSTNNTIINQNYAIGGAFTHILGQSQTVGPVNGRFCDLNLAEVHYIDGQYLDSTSFGQFDAATDAFTPKAYTGSYGTVGYYLDFSDNSAATAAAIGADRSGNGNNWTPTNISVAAGVTNDSLVDTPTNYGTDTGAGGEVRGNYCTLNPLDKGITLSNGNLDYTQSAAGLSRATFAMSSGKWRWEIKIGTLGSSLPGIATASASLSGYPGSDAFAWAWSGTSKFNAGSSALYGSAYTTGDVIGIEFDADIGTLTFFKNGVSQGAAYTGLTSGPYFPCVGANTGTTAGTANFGQRVFDYSGTSGFKALCTQNLPDPAIKQPNKYFDAKPYAGNGATQSVSGLSLQPDLVWIKSRSAIGRHSLTDSVRGAGHQLFSDGTDAEGSQSDQVTGFNVDGFSLGANAAGTGSTNVSGTTYVPWLWKKGATPGFDIQSPTASASGNQTINHSLGVPPEFVVFKARSGGTANWQVWVNGIGTDNLYLNTTAARNAAGYMISQSSTTFVFNIALVYPSNPYVAYLWASVPGFSKFGSYTGNGSADGPFVWCGFRPRWIMLKRIDAIGDWIIYDTARDTFNVMSDALRPDLANAETVIAGGSIDVLASGFKLRGTLTDINASGGTYIFAAFAHYPFKYARGR